MIEDVSLILKALNCHKAKDDQVFLEGREEGTLKFPVRITCEMNLSGGQKFHR